MQRAACNALVRQIATSASMPCWSAIRAAHAPSSVRLRSVPAADNVQHAADNVQHAADNVQDNRQLSIVCCTFVCAERAILCSPAPHERHPSGSVASNVDRSLGGRLVRACERACACHRPTCRVVYDRLAAMAAERDETPNGRRPVAAAAVAVADEPLVRRVDLRVV